MYWWNEEIEEKKRSCFAARRKITRSKGNLEFKRNHALAKKDFRLAFKLSQKAKWLELLNQVDKNPWGLAYKIVTNKLKGRQEFPELNNQELVKQVISDLFPNQVEQRRLREINYLFDKRNIFTLQDSS